MRVFILSVLIELVLFSMSIDAQDIVSDTLVDLNGDGKPEIIVLKNNESFGFILSISGIQYTDSPYDNPPDRLEIIDIDKTDTYKEVLLHFPSSTDDPDDGNMILWYNGSSIFKMGDCIGWPVFPGNGIVYIDHYTGFWTQRDKYEIDPSTGKLIHVPQYGYFVGVRATVKKPFVIYREQELQHKVALLARDSEIELILYAPGNNELVAHFYLVKSQTGLTGWVKEFDVFDYLEGIPYFD